VSCVLLAGRTGLYTCGATTRTRGKDLITHPGDGDARSVCDSRENGNSSMVYCTRMGRKQLSLVSTLALVEASFQKPATAQPNHDMANIAIRTPAQYTYLPTSAHLRWTIGSIIVDNLSTPLGWESLHPLHMLIAHGSKSTAIRESRDCSSWQKTGR
jgi:hypothetical protein